MSACDNHLEMPALIIPAICHKCYSYAIFGVGCRYDVFTAQYTVYHLIRNEITDMLYNALC